jgi:hypothetical protein
MDATLHDSDSDALDVADYKIASMADGGAARKSRNFGVRNTNGVTQFISEASETGAQDERDAGTQGRERQHGLRGVFSVEKFVEVGQAAISSQLLAISNSSAFAATTKRR